MSISLFLRKRRVLLAIFLFSFTYFVVATYKQLKRRVVEEEDVVHSLKIDEILRNDPPPQAKNVLADLPEAAQSIHRSLLELNSTSEKVYLCRNSVQGRSLVADLNGYVCDRFDLETNGCCRVNAPSTKRYACDTCSNSGCCSQYEGCVSCCLHPQKGILLRKALDKKGTNINRVYSLITDRFDLCLTKCRTSSESVRHENSYIDPSLKYCFGSSGLHIDPPVNKTKAHRKPRIHL